MTELSDLVSRYEDSASATFDARRRSERCRDYYDGKQLTDEELAALRKRKQPEVISNRIKAKVKFLKGTETKKRTDPKAFPRTPGDDGGAEAATDAIRYVCDKNDFPQKRSKVFEIMLIEGYGGGVIEIKRYGDLDDVCLTRIRWDRYFYDPHSTEDDFSDAKYQGIVTWMDVDDGVELYGEKFQEAADNSFTNSQGVDDETYNDKPYKCWSDSKRKRIKVCEIYYREKGKWMHAVYTKAAYIIDPKESTYVDEYGKPVCPIEMQSCFVDRENNRYGEVWDYLSPQDEINKRKSKSLHLISTRQVVAEAGAVNDVNKARNELAKPDGIVVVNPGLKFDIIPTTDMAMGNMQLLQEAKSEIDAMGANIALQGREGIQSGRALQAKQQSGDTEQDPLLDGLRSWNKRVYKQIWWRVRQYWTAPMWIRVTDDEKKLKFVGLNQQTTAGELEAEKLAKSNMSDEQKQQALEQIAMNPASQQPAMRNDVTKMDVDIILDDVPDTVNIQGEQFELLSQMYMAAPDKIPLEMVIEASSFRNKDKLLEYTKGSSPEAQAMNAERQAVGKANLDKTNSETEKNLASAQNQRAQAVAKVSDASAKAMQPMPGNGQTQAAADTGDMRIQ